MTNELGIEILIAHYAKRPYTSKYNPIEHRMFPHITQACQGGTLSIELVKGLIESTKTSKRLTLTLKIIYNRYIFYTS